VLLRTAVQKKSKSALLVQQSTIEEK